MCIGHVRYSTSNKESTVNCIQPLTSTSKLGYFSIAHNGHIHNLDRSPISKSFNYSLRTSEIKKFLSKQA